MKIIKAIITGFFLYLLTSIPVLAVEDIEAEERKQIIFLLDSSYSMKAEGRWESAIDCVSMITAVLPDDYETAVLAYNEGIVFCENFGNISQQTPNNMKDINLQGYTSPAVGLKEATLMFDPNVSERRIVFVTDGEISMPDSKATAEATEEYQKMAEEAALNDIKIDMFVIPNKDIENEVAYGTEATSGTVYTSDKIGKLEELAEKYLFDLLKLEKIELGESLSGAGKLTIDLQNTYIETAKVILISTEGIKDFQISGQCERLETTQGSRFAVAKLTNPMERQLVVEYTLENKESVRIYLMKEYDLQTQAEILHTDAGAARIEVAIKNHQGKNVLEASDIKEGTVILLNGEQKDYGVENGKAVLSYEPMETGKIELEAITRIPGSIVYNHSMKDSIELTMPTDEEGMDYRVLWIVIISLIIVLLFLTFAYQGKKQKKNVIEEDTTITNEGSKVNRLEAIANDFSGQIAVYLIKGEGELDLPPKSIRLFGMMWKHLTFAWIKDRCGIHYKLRDADKLCFFGGKDHALCFKNHGCATICKGNDILRRDKKYELFYGEKIFLIFNEGRTELELHYKNIKPNKG